MLKLAVGQVRLSLLQKLLLQFLDGSLVLGPQIVDLLTLGDELLAKLVLYLGVDLILLPQLLEYLSQVTPAET